MWQKFYVKKTDESYSVFEDFGPAMKGSRLLATFQTEWAANEFCRFCTATEPKSSLINPYGLVISNSGISGFVTGASNNTTSNLKLGSVTLVTFDLSGKVTDLYLGRLVGYWLKIKYQKHLKPVLIRLWYGEKHGSK